MEMLAGVTVLITVAASFFGGYYLGRSDGRRQTMRRFGVHEAPRQWKVMSGFSRGPLGLD